jgi:hypothetical protein
MFSTNRIDDNGVDDEAQGRDVVVVDSDSIMLELSKLHRGSSKLCKTVSAHGFILALCNPRFGDWGQETHEGHDSKAFIQPVINGDSPRGVWFFPF